MKISGLIFIALACSYSYGQTGNNETFPVLSTYSVSADTLPASLQKNGNSPPLSFHLKYNLELPDQTFEMPDILNEISGLGFDPGFNTLYAVQDENGIIFRIDKLSGGVENEFPFHKDGDYEDIEIVGDVVYVIKSSGTIYEITNPGKEDQHMTKHNVFLSKENDVEGLCFDPARNKLLLACKGIPATGESFEVIRHKKVVYGFDINTKEMDSIPVYDIRLDEIQKCIQSCATIKDADSLSDIFSSEREVLEFNPSAIAIHPFTGDVYILSSAGKTLVVLNYEGEVIYIEKLNQEIHRQPEGIAFDADGTLYISNEGKDGDSPAKIYRFNYSR